MPSLLRQFPLDEEQMKWTETGDPEPETEEMEDLDESNVAEETTVETEGTKDAEEAEEMEKNSEENDDTNGAKNSEENDDTNGAKNSEENDDTNGAKNSEENDDTNGAKNSEENDDTNGATSDEASSLIKDFSVVPRVPAINSSDEERERPSTTVEDDTEPMEFSTTVGHVRQQPSRNVARRARRLSVNFESRGRYRHPFSRQELFSMRPFDRGLTFNGFHRNLEPERLHGFFHDVISDEILYRVSWRNNVDRLARPIEASLMRTFRPAMVVEFYEALVARNRFLNLHNR